MAELTYNGLTIRMLGTQSVSFVPARSEDGVDYYGTKAVFDVSCSVNASLYASLFPGMNSTQVMGNVEHMLNQPRKPLVYSVNGQTLVHIDAPPDLNQGPFPGPVVVRRVGGSETFLIEFHLETTFIQCVGGLTPNPLWVSHRYSETIDLDKLAMSGRIRRGTIIARADLSVNPDQLRDLIAPKIEKNFNRTSSRYMLSSDGTRLDYEFKDEQVWAQPPPPAFDADGEFILSSAQGALQYGECRVRLKGSTASDKGTLLAVAVDICLARLNTADIAKGKGGSYVALAGVMESLYENVVECRVKALLKGTKERQGTPAKPGRLAMSMRTFGVPPLYSEPGTPPPDPGVRGSALLELVAPYMQDPCAQQAVLRTGGAGANRLVGVGEVPEAKVTISTLTGTDMQAEMATGDPGIFTDYQISLIYRLAGNAFLVPVADSKAPAEVVQTARPTMKKYAEWAARKIGAPPELPSPSTLGDPNLVVLNTEITADEAKNSGDGVSKEFVVSGRYELGAKDAAKVAVGPAVPPWMEPSGMGKVAILKTFEQSQFQTGVIDYADQNNGPTLAFMIDGVQLNTPPGGGTGPGN